MNLDFYFFMAKSHILVTPRKGVFIGNSPLLRKNIPAFREKILWHSNLGIKIFTNFLMFELLIFLVTLIN